MNESVTVRITDFENNICCSSNANVHRVWFTTSHFVFGCDWTDIVSQGPPHCITDGTFIRYLSGVQFLITLVSSHINTHGCLMSSSPAAVSGTVQNRWRVSQTQTDLDSSTLLRGMGCCCFPAVSLISDLGICLSSAFLLSHRELQWVEVNILSSALKVSGCKSSNVKILSRLGSEPSPLCH